MKRRPSLALGLAIYFAFLLLFGVLMGLSVGCTVTPAAISSTQASYDGTERNSGILASVEGGYTVTARFRERYNGLIASYGSAWSPAIAADYGLTPRIDGTWLCSAEAMEKFLVMNAWRRMGRAPAK